ncbi:hypothetical protein Tco_0366512 [Tanacetum coccineum]
MLSLNGFRLSVMSSHIGKHIYLFMDFVLVTMAYSVELIPQVRPPESLPCIRLFAHHHLFLVIRAVFNPLWLPAFWHSVHILAVKGLCDTLVVVFFQSLFLEFEDSSKVVVVETGLRLRSKLFGDLFPLANCLVSGTGRVEGRLLYDGCIRVVLRNDEEFVTVSPSKICAVERTPGSMSCIYYELFSRKDRGWEDLAVNKTDFNV